MNYIKALKDINNFLKKEADKKYIEYYIINNTLGKNLILIEALDTSYDEDKIVKELEKKYKEYISEIILTNEEDEEFINEIKKVCSKNNFIHKNISYNSWQQVNEEELQFDFKDDNIITGYSFKGGMGRSQSLAYLALFLSIIGKKVVVLDCDFEAPGIATILGKQNGKLGIIDYLIEINLKNEIDLKKYYCKNNLVNNLIVFSSGIEYEPKSYIDRLSKIDFNSESFFENFCILINNIKEQIKPDYIFIDLRAGISESNGKILQKISTKNLLFFNNDEQNLIGLEIVLNQILSKENLKENSKYYLINSLIRDYNLSYTEGKKESFSNFIKENFKSYINNIYNLLHEAKFLNNSFEELYKLTTNNVTLYLERSTSAQNLTETIDKLNVLLRKIEGDENKKNFSELLSLREIILRKEKSVKNPSQIKKNFIDIFLFDILNEILLVEK